MVITKTPLRISLVGGSTDMPSFYKKHVGAVVSFAINKYVYVSVNKKFDSKIRVSYSTTENVEHIDHLQHDLVRESLRYFKINDGVEITSVSDIPGEGSGLGSSSCFTVGLVNALSHGSHPSILAERAFEIEANKCHRPVGKQDHFASAYGGMNYFVFTKNSVETTAMYASEELKKHSLLLYTGMTRKADSILKGQRQAFDEGATTDTGRKLAILAKNFYHEYLTGMEMDRLGDYLTRSWNFKKQLASGITNPQIDIWMNAALGMGAHGGKVLGAGGGGFLYFIAPPEIHGRIAASLRLKLVDFKIETRGSEVIYNG